MLIFDVFHSSSSLAVSTQRPITLTERYCIPLVNIYRRLRWLTAEINPTLILINMKGQRLKVTLPPHQKPLIMFCSCILTFFLNAVVLASMFAWVVPAAVLLFLGMVQ